MPNFVYTSDIPDENDNPSVDQPDMKTNTNSISSILEVDHYGFNDNNGGYHKPIHIVQQTNSSTNPTPVATTNIVYSKPYTPNTTGGTEDIQLYSISAGGTIAQLTGNNTSNSFDGWFWSGGVLIQWGYVASTSTSGSVTFQNRVTGAIPFPNNCFNVSITLSYSGSAVASFATIGVRDFTKTQFRWRANGLALSGADGFYWTAIGN